MLRREFFKVSTAGIAGAIARQVRRSRRSGSSSRSRAPFPPEGLAMYPTGVKFISVGLGLKTMTPEGYDAVIDRIGPAGEQLAKQGANAVVLMGTSLSFYKGAAFNERLTETLKKATGLPATTMSTGVIEGLRTVGAKSVVAATAYDDGSERALAGVSQRVGLRGARREGPGHREGGRRRSSDARRTAKVLRGRTRNATESQCDSGLVRRTADARDPGAFGAARSCPGGFQHAACAVGGRSAAGIERARSGIRNAAVESLTLVKKLVFVIAIAMVLAMVVVAWRLRQAANGLNVTPSAAREIEKAQHH